LLLALQRTTCQADDGRGRSTDAKSARLLFRHQTTKLAARLISLKERCKKRGSMEIPPLVFQILFT